MLTRPRQKEASSRPKIENIEDAYVVLHHSWNMDEINLLEEAKILLLDNQLRLMSIASISKGGLSGTVVDPKITFSIALKRRVNKLILVHNHPCGSLKPSNADIRLTGKFKNAGRILDMPVEDHIIITDGRYYSILSDYSQNLFEEEFNL